MKTNDNLVNVLINNFNLSYDKSVFVRYVLISKITRVCFYHLLLFLNAESALMTVFNEEAF